ncbi:MAG: hypothetical protein V1886_03515 [archaeon]
MKKRCCRRLYPFIVIFLAIGVLISLAVFTARTVETLMSVEEAIAIAQNTECTEKGMLTQDSFYNPNSKTWWISLEMNPEFRSEICNPACVIDAVQKTAEINWRCTGFISE